MFGYSYIHTTDLNQGTNLYDTFLTDYLDASYFQAEPRTTINWVILIRAISQKLTTHGESWKDLFPPELSDDLIAEYIEDPRGTIELGKFTESEIKELRQPHRILLFYFLKKISCYEPENDRIVRNYNNFIAENIFGAKPEPAKPDTGYAIINTEEEIQVEIHKTNILEAIIETEPFTRKYLAHSELVGTTMRLVEAYNAFPKGVEKLGIERYPLPLEGEFFPFRKNPQQRIDAEYQPAINIQSPLLCMREGDRSIHITLTFEEEKELDLDMIDFKLSTYEGWVSVPNDKVGLEMKKINSKVFQFDFTVSSEFPPIAPKVCPDVEETDELELIEPCQKEGGLLIHFKKIAGKIAVKEISLWVEAKGLMPMAIRNQDQVLETKDNFQPFGLDAEAQTTFSFAHPELTHPAITQIKTTPIWVGKPEEFDTYYEGYPDISEETLKLNVKTIYKDIQGITYEEYTNATDVPVFETHIKFQPLEYPVNVVVPCGKWDTEQLDPLEHNLYFQFELTPQGFGVSEYPILMTNYSVDYARYANKWFPKESDKPAEVNIPYIPLWSQFTIDYETAPLVWKADDPNEQEIDVILYEPLGYQPYTGEQISMGENKRGFLAIGINQVTESSTGSLYLNGLVGNTRADEGKISWWYLSAEGWKDFTPFILIDETYQLTQTGLFTWSIPPDMVSRNPLMPRGIFWLKATLEKQVPDEVRACTPKWCNEQSACQFSLITINGIFANAISIVRESEELMMSKNAQYLPAGSELTLPQDNVEYTLINPFRTSGEEMEESELEFWARVFNRVRNRRRMVEIQDFEDLILSEFRDLALVKCNPRIVGSNRVNIAVVNKQFYGTSYPYENAPKCSVHTLQKIENFVRERTSPFFQTVIEPKVVNPCYREIGFLVCVVFKDDALAAENKERLYEDLRRYINPWLYQKYLVPKFGCWFDYGSVMGELQSKDYIEAIIELKLGFVNGNELDFQETVTTGPDDVLMLSNINNIVALDSMDEFERLGVGTMEIDLDFIVGI